MEFLFPLVLLITGLGILILGAEWLVRGASSIAQRFGISSLVVGLTIVAFGTSAPELAVSVYSALTGSTDLAVGNVIGSNIANILLILGVTAAVTPLTVSSSTVKWELPLAILASVMILVLGSDVVLDHGFSNVISRIDGIVLLGFMMIFMFYIFTLAKHTPPPEEGNKKPLGILLSIGLVIVGLCGLVFGGKLLVDSAVILATLAGLSEAVIGLTVVAVGTSLPELATSIIAALKKEIDIAVGNIVGSNIFNVFWILGLTSVIAPLPAPENLLISATVAIGASILLFFGILVGKRDVLQRWEGVLFLILYVAYITYLVV
jgi:cation:H+ antiporter